MPDNLSFLRSRKNILIATAVIGLGLGARGCFGAKTKNAKESMRRVSVARQPLRITKIATGEVRPQNRVEVKPPIAGRIEEVLVREGESATQGQVLVWMSSSERAALLDAARAQGPEAVARWETVYKPAPLTAPLNGTVIVRAVEPGQTVTTGDAVVVIADRLIVNAQVDETDIGAIKVGQAAHISLDAYPEEKISAHVDHVAYEATTVNNVTIYEVDVLPDAVPEVMRSGMTATVTFTVMDKPDALVIPAEALKQDGASASVLLAAGQLWEKPRKQAVVSGLSDGKWTEIISGLKEGDVVLIASLRLPRSSGNRGRNPFSPAGRGGGSANRSRQ